MGRNNRKRAAKKRVQLGYFPCALSYHLPSDDLVDVVAVMLRDHSPSELPALDRPGLAAIALAFVEEVGQEGIKRARRQVEDRELVPDAIYDAVENAAQAAYPELFVEPVEQG